MATQAEVEAAILEFWGPSRDNIRPYYDRMRAALEAAERVRETQTDHAELLKDTRYEPIDLGVDRAIDPAA